MPPPTADYRQRGSILKFLSFLNWIALGIGALMTLLYAVVCLMMLPYPQLVSDAGAGFAHVLRITAVMTAFTAVAGLSTWLLQKRHRALWLGQALLAMAFALVILFAVAQRY